MKRIAVGFAMIAIVLILTSNSITTDAFAWDPFGIFKAKENLDEAEKNLKRVTIECLLTDGYDQCLMACSDPIVDKPMDCVKNVKNVNKELTK